IGPIGNRLRPSYRRELNRPRYLGGKLAYAIAPTSQEAIVWHRAEHQSLYANDACRNEPHYFYPKPWESLQNGPRRPVDPATNGLRPLPDGEFVPLTQGRYGDNASVDTMAIADGENEPKSAIIDTPPADGSGMELLPAPLSPSDKEPTAEFEAVGSGLKSK
ncbi:MAG: hypothetical protein WBD20_07125, partial [Pirellulaceae bacterium]